MSRLTYVALLAATALVVRGEPISKQLAKLEQLGNPFWTSGGNSAKVTTGSLYAALAAVANSGVLFSSNDTGCLFMEGAAWRTGERRTISTAQGRIQVLFVALERGAEDQKPSALFRSEISGEETAVDLKGPTAPVELSTDNAGWLLSDHHYVTADKVPGASVRVRVGHVSYPAHTVARSATSGLVLYALNDRVAAPLVVAPADYAGPALVMPLHGELIRVSASALTSPPPRESLVGAMATTPDGQLLGIVGKQGLVAPAALGLPTSSVPPIRNPAPFARRVSFLPDSPAR